jgi:hypothetical protein
MTGPLEGDRPLSEEAREGNGDPGDDAREEASQTDDTYSRTSDADSADSN